MTIWFPTAFVARSWNETLGSCQGDVCRRIHQTVSSYPSLTLRPYKLHSYTCVRSRRRAICGQCPPPPIVPASENLPRGAWGVVVGSTWGVPGPKTQVLSSSSSWSSASVPPLCSRKIVRNTATRVFHRRHDKCLEALHNWLRPIKCSQLRFWNFGSHFMSVQIFQIDILTLPLILTCPKYFRCSLCISWKNYT